MADYKHEGFDTYGYVEEIKFVPMQVKCGATYTKAANNEPTLTEAKTVASQDFVEQNNLTLPTCDCLRK